MVNTWNEEWSGRIKSLKGNVYIIRICTAGATQSKILTLGADAVTLQTDTSDEALKASRITTGYLRVVNTGNVEDIVPDSDTEHYVEIQAEDGKVLFAGFQQNLQFDKDMYLPNQIIELPLIDTLGALDTMKMDGSREMCGESFASLLKEACDAIPGITRVVYPKTWKDAQGKYYGWLQLKANRLNWFEQNSSDSIDEDLTRYNGMSYLHMLEEIAKLMGWTLTQKGQQLRFISLDATSYQSVSMAMLEAVDAGTAIVPTEITIGGNATLESLQHGGVQNTSTVISGHKRVSVIGDVGPCDDLGISLGTEGAEYFGTYESSGGTIREKSLVYRSEQKNLTLYSYELEDADAHRMRADYLYYDPNSDNPILDNNTAPFFIDTQLEKYDSFNTLDGEKVNWNFPASPSVCIRYKFKLDEGGSGEAYKGLVNPVRLFKIGGGALHQQSGGCIDMKVEGRFGMASAASLTARASLKVGQYYWHGDSWSTDAGLFTFGIRDGKTITTKTLDMPYAACEGYVIPLPDYVYGEVTFELVTFPEDGASYQIPPIAFARRWWIDRIALDYVNSLNEDFTELKDTVTYSAKADENFKENKVINLSLVTKTMKCKNGIGVLMYGDHLFRKGDLKFNGTSKMPEEVLLQKMKQWYGVSKTILSVRLRQLFDVGAQIFWSSKPYKVMACTWNMADDIYEYKLIEI